MAQTKIPVGQKARFSFKSAAIAGSIAGVAFLAVILPLNALIKNVNPWATLRMIAAIVLGKGVLPPPATFDILVLVAALVLHFALSILYTSIGAIVSRPARTAAFLMGVILGLLLYMINFYIFTGLFPWFEGARNWISMLTHVVFGSVASLLYLHLRIRKHGGDATAGP